MTRAAIDRKSFSQRAASIYSGQFSRVKRQLFKSVPKGVSITFARNEILPYTRQQFEAWLWASVGLNVVRCPYCQTFIDFRSLVIDHKVPLKLGGSLDLENQEPVCERCNQLKNELLPGDFQHLMTFLANGSPHLRSYVESCLLSAAEGKRVKFYSRTKQSKFAA